MRLIDCFIPFLAELRAFAERPNGEAEAQAAQLDARIAAARRAAADMGARDADIDAALFACVSWADEVLIRASWAGATHWQAHLLQRRYFNVNNAGVAFFTRLEQLTPEQMPVRAVYYLCLAMGFGGRYAYDRNQKALSDIKRTNLALLLAGEARLGRELGSEPCTESSTESSTQPDAPLFPDGYATHAAVMPVTGGRWSWFKRPWSRRATGFVLIPFLLLLLLLGAFHIALSQSAQTVQALLAHTTL